MKKNGQDKSEKVVSKVISKKPVIIGFAFFILLTFGIFVFIQSIKQDFVKIQLSNNQEIIVLTAKTKVADILKENNIVIAPNEEVYPPINEHITETKTITITLIKIENPDDEEEEGEEEPAVNEPENIREAILTLMEAVPFEIIINDTSDGAESVITEIAQYGRIGLKEVEYRMIYQNNKEVDRVELKSQIVREPVDHIIAIQKKPAKSSSPSASSAAERRSDLTALLPDQYVVTAYCACIPCCGKTDGITASGVRAVANHTIAAPPIFAFGTQILINGKPEGNIPIEVTADLLAPAISLTTHSVVP